MDKNNIADSMQNDNYEKDCPDFSYKLILVGH